MNPSEPESAHRIVAEYARLLERSDGQEFPASVRRLPHAKPTIKAAILTCVASLRASAELTPEMLAFLEEAYVALADYVDDDVVQVMAEYRETLAAVAGVPAAREKVHTEAWRRLAGASGLAGRIARAIAEDSAALRAEFRAGA